MRAAASRDWVLARSWQSQRVTRRSGDALGPFDCESVDRAGDGAVFQPVPSHSGQTSAETFINPGTLFNKISSFDFAPESGLGASANQRAIVHILCRSRRHCGGQRKNGGGRLKNARARVRGRALPNIASRLAKRPDPCQKWLRQRQFATPQCEIGFRRGFSQLTFRPEGGEYSRQVFQTQRAPSSRYCAGNENKPA
jgi:hypothetical protein